MDRVAFKLNLKPGNQAEYKKVHDEIWPEMLEVLEQAGISNYTIWNTGDDIFGYYETPDKAETYRVLSESPVVDRWNEMMSAIYFPDLDPETGTVKEMKLMFQFGIKE
jgi:L-rhamnose mutarotase